MVCKKGETQVTVKTRQRGLPVDRIHIVSGTYIWDDLIRPSLLSRVFHFIETTPSTVSNLMVKPQRSTMDRPFHFRRYLHYYSGKLANETTL
jgi:hypothetical protein